MNLKIVVSSIEETHKLASSIAKLLQVGDVITLCGDLGAGKTTFVSQIGKMLNIPDKVISPTFNILKCYFGGDINLYHIDAYRLEDGNKDIGLEEFIEGDGVCFIEWPQYIKELLCVDTLDIRITILDETRREFELISSSKRFDKLIEEIKV